MAARPGRTSGRGASIWGGPVIELQALADRFEINELLARYARAVDDHDWDLYRSVFTDDAYIDYRSAGGIDGPRDAVAAFLEEAFAGITWSQHYITNVEIELDGDAAKVHAMFYNPMQFPGFDEPSSCGGRYLHDLSRTSAGWKSARLVEDNRWFVNSPFDT